MARKKPVSRILSEGADVMAQRGNARHTLQDGHGRVCLIGALNHAAHGDALWRRSTEGRVLDAGLLTVDGKGSVAPWTWNNEHASGAVEVVEAMRDAAVRARGSELAVERERAMRHPLGRRPRPEVGASSITPEMRQAWATAADKLERTNRADAILDESRVIPDFDWGAIIREEEVVAEENQRRTREYLEANPLGVATGPGA